MDKRKKNKAHTVCKSAIICISCPFKKIKVRYRCVDLLKCTYPWPYFLNIILLILLEFHILYPIPSLQCLPSTLITPPQEIMKKIKILKILPTPLGDDLLLYRSQISLTLSQQSSAPLSSVCLFTPPIPTLHHIFIHRSGWELWCVTQYMALPTQLLLANIHCNESLGWFMASGFYYNVNTEPSL